MAKEYEISGKPLRSLLNEIKKSKGARTLCGMDEAGRGALAGPVVAAAVVLTKNSPKELADSKALTDKRRRALFDEIRATALVGVGIVSSQEVDRLNILEANFVAMQAALTQLADQSGLTILVDGNFLTQQIRDQADRMEASIFAVVKGDALVPAISAASIIAKVSRALLMEELHEKHPHYGFADNAGYGSPAHLEALKQHGPCEWHRRTFTPVVDSLQMALI